MQRPKWIPRWLHLSFVIFVAFIVWMLAFGDNNFFKTHALKSQAQDLKAEIQSVIDSTRYYEMKAQELQGKPEAIEKTCREQYGMKKENEEVYEIDIP